jgi:hypothetical protein
MSGTSLFSDYFSATKKKQYTTPMKSQSLSNKENSMSNHDSNQGRLFSAVLSVQNKSMKSPSSTTSRHVSMSDAKSLNLSHSKKKLDFSQSEMSPSPFKARKVPNFDVPFTVYKSSKPLTIPKEPNITSVRYYHKKCVINC